MDKGFGEITGCKETGGFFSLVCVYFLDWKGLRADKMTLNQY